GSSNELFEGGCLWTPAFCFSSFPFGLLIISSPQLSPSGASDSTIVHRPQSWQDIIAAYQHADSRRAWIQILNSFLPYLALWVAMVWSLEVSYWITLGLAALSVPFLTRIFIIFHD